MEVRARILIPVPSRTALRPEPHTNLLLPCERLLRNLVRCKHYSKNPRCLGFPYVSNLKTFLGESSFELICVFRSSEQKRAILKVIGIRINQLLALSPHLLCSVFFDQCFPGNRFRSRIRQFSKKIVNWRRRNPMGRGKLVIYIPNITLVIYIPNITTSTRFS